MLASSGTRGGQAAGTQAPTRSCHSSSDAAWLYVERSVMPLEACGSRWKQVMRALAAGPSDVLSVSKSAVTLMHTSGRWSVQQARGECTRHSSFQRQISPHLGDVEGNPSGAAAFDQQPSVSLRMGRPGTHWRSRRLYLSPVLKHCLNTIKAWHQLLQLRVLLNAPGAAGDYLRFTQSLGHF